VAVTVAPPARPIPTTETAAQPVTVSAAGVAHTFRGRDATAVPAIERIDLEVTRGDLVALLGPSGCGKSTLLRVLSGLIQPTHGSVLLGGASVPEARTSQGIGWLAQEDGLLPWMSVAENVGLPGRVGHRRATVTDDAVARILSEVGLTDSARRYPHELSGGMRQRAALARALVSEPHYLFLDEPFASLDEITRERLGDLLLTVRAARRPTTLLVTHSVVEAVRLADRVLVLSPRPARITADIRIDLERPRRYDQHGFGAVVQGLQAELAAHDARPNG
jgi:NitT/TauT family transport system ATP-binding protein